MLIHIKSCWSLYLSWCQWTTERLRSCLVNCNANNFKRKIFIIFSVHV